MTDHIFDGDKLVALRPMTRAELVKELHAITVLLPRMLPTSPQMRASRRQWKALRVALVAEIARRSAFNHAEVRA